MPRVSAVREERERMIRASKLAARHATSADRFAARARHALLGTIALIELPAFLLCVRIEIATAQERIVIDPPNAKIERTRPGIGAPAAAAAGATGHLPIVTGGEAAFELNIQYTEAKIYNPGTDQYDSVRLRSYRDVREAALPKVPFVAPTVEIFPGETVR